MGCKALTNEPKKLKMTWAADAKEYTPTELDKIIGLIDQSITFLGTVSTRPNEDTIMLRVGAIDLSEIDTVTSKVVNDTTIAYADVGFAKQDGLTSNVGIDFISVTSYKSESKADKYHYSSPSSYEVIADTFVFGLSNYTGNKAYNNFNLKAINGAYTAPIRKNVDSYPMVRYNNSNTDVTLVDSFTLPAYVKNMFTYIVHNLKLISKIKNTEISGLINVGTNINGIVGDHLLYTITQMIGILVKTKNTCIGMKSEFYPAYYEKIKRILVISGLDKAFTDIEYGGLIEQALITIQIPASVQYNKELKDTLELVDIAAYKYNKLTSEVNNADKKSVTQQDREDYFNSIFKTVLLGSPDFSEMEKLKDPRLAHYKEYDNALAAYNKAKVGTLLTSDEYYAIRMWYANEKWSTKDKYHLWNKLQHLPKPVNDGKIGCEVANNTSIVDDKGNTTTVTTKKYKYYKIDAAWWVKQPVSVKVGLFYMGFDFKMDKEKNPCPFDQVFVLIITVIMAFFVGPAAFAISAAVGWIFVISTVLSIAMQMGMIEGRAARIASIVIAAGAIYSAGATLASNAGTAVGITLNQSITALTSVVSSITQAIRTNDVFQFQQASKKLSDEMNELSTLLNDDADKFVSNLRFEQSQVFDWSTGKGIYESTDAIYRDYYKEFTSYGNSSGFKQR